MGEESMNEELLECMEEERRAGSNELAKWKRESVVGE
jgi:hypothetical protein